MKSSLLQTHRHRAGSHIQMQLNRTVQYSFIRCDFLPPVVLCHSLPHDLKCLTLSDRETLSVFSLLTITDGQGRQLQGRLMSYRKEQTNNNNEKKRKKNRHNSMSLLFVDTDSWLWLGCVLWCCVATCRCVRRGAAPRLRRKTNARREKQRDGPC